jgi:hypothetical protein
MRVVDRMRIPSSTEQYGVFPLDLVEHKGLANNASQFPLMPLGVAIVVNAIPDSDPIETGAQIQKHSRLSSRAGLTPDHTANQSSGKAVEREPTVSFGFLVKEVQHNLSLLAYPSH